MTIRERIITYLQTHPTGVDDDELTTALQLKHRAQANKRCRRLANEGLMNEQAIKLTRKFFDCRRFA